MLVKFGATWCAPCKVMDKQLETLGVSYESVDIEEQAERATYANIRSVPTLIKYDDNGKETARANSMSLQALKEFLSE